VLVLDQGLLVECGEPHALLQSNAGIFSGMVEQTGTASSSYLRGVARSASITRLASRNATQLRQLRQLAGGGAGGGSDSRRGSFTGGGPPHSLRLESEVLGRRYVDQPVVLPMGGGCDVGSSSVYEDTAGLGERRANRAAGSRSSGDGGGGGGGAPTTAGPYARSGSTFGLARYGDPMAGAGLAGGAAYTRELSLLERNTAAGDVQQTSSWVDGLVRNIWPGMQQLAPRRSNSRASADGGGAAPQQEAAAGPAAAQQQRQPEW
jgi:hypothetical protein